MAAMNNDMGAFAGRPTTSRGNPLESALYGAGPGLNRSGLGAYDHPTFVQSAILLSSQQPVCQEQAEGCLVPDPAPAFMAAMNNDMGGFAGRPTTSQANPLESALYGAGPGLIRSGLGAYGEKFLGSSSEFMQSNITQHLSNPQYYFQVNNQYVRNKLKVVLFPFLHRGHWTRITEPVGGRLSYKPPVQDINAPDLYIPLMAFGTYIVIAGYALGVLGRFTPEALTLQFTKGLLGWFLQTILIKSLLYTLGSGESPLLDIVAYAGYGFAGTSLAMVVRVFWSYSYYFVLPWFCFCTGVFLVKTMKRVLQTATRSYERHPSRNHYFLLFLAAVQFPILFWLGNISGA